MVWEERWHPLREEWVLVSDHRDKRPWLGERVAESGTAIPAYDPSCTLCPGNVRVSGAKNPDYSDVWVFNNDLPCAGPDAPLVNDFESGPFRRRSARGRARVVCYAPDHRTTLAEMTEDGIDRLLATWQIEYRELGSEDDVNHVLMFENKGAVVGVSNPHPHGQIYATNFVFKTIEIEARAAQRRFDESKRSLFAEILDAEFADGRRIVVDCGSAVAFVPYFARYAYETYVAPKATYRSVADLSIGERRDLARCLKETLTALDNLWRMSMPYVLVLHQAPTDGSPWDGFHFHIEIHPPLRKPGLLKYLAGPEIGGGSFLNDTAPETKAAELRAAKGPHWMTEVRP